MSVPSVAATAKVPATWQFQASMAEVRLVHWIDVAAAQAHRETRRQFECARRAATSRYLYALAGVRMRRMFDLDFRKGM